MWNICNNNIDIQLRTIIEIQLRTFIKIHFHSEIYCEINWDSVYVDVAWIWQICLNWMKWSIAVVYIEPLVINPFKYIIKI